MGSTELEKASPTECSSLPMEYVTPKWYAAYTSANHEKRVAQQLARQSVKHYLPLYQSVRRWKDRRVKLELPLFPGYVFVQIALRDRLRVVQIPGVVRLVGFNGMPTALKEEEIEALRKGLERGMSAEPHPYLTTGRRVRVKHGPLAGLEGVLLRRKGNWRVVLSLNLIQRSVSVDLDLSDLEPARCVQPGVGAAPVDLDEGKGRTAFHRASA
jgi:transcription antitermination factor NusG